MESINFAKGYGKVNPKEGESISPPNHAGRRLRRRIVAVSLAVVLTLVVACLITALIHESKGSKPSELASSSTDALKTVCSVTRYPDSCISSISPLNSPPSDNPFRLFNLSLHASLLEMSSLRSQIGEPPADRGLRDCGELFDDAVSQLGRSAESICVEPGQKVLTEMRISDLQTWISAAMTDVDTCLEGLEEVGSTALSELKVKVQKSQEYMSNTLAILNDMKTLSHKFGLTMP